MNPLPLPTALYCPCMHRSAAAPPARQAACTPAAGAHPPGTSPSLERDALHLGLAQHLQLLSPLAQQVLHQLQVLGADAPVGLKLTARKGMQRRPLLGGLGPDCPDDGPVGVVWLCPKGCGWC